MNNVFQQLMPMLKFLWSHAPQRLKYLVMGLALLAGMSRDWVMMVVNKAAATPVSETISYWLPIFIFTFFVVIVASFLYQIVTTVVTTYVVNAVRLKLINGLLKVQPSFIDKREHGNIYHILTTDVSAVAGFTNTILNLLPSFIFLTIAIPQVFTYSLVAGSFVILVMVGGSLAYHLQQKKMASLNNNARTLEVAYFERMSEMLKGFRELRLHLPRRHSFSGDVGEILEQHRKLQIQVSRIYEVGESAVNALKFMLFAGIVFLVPYLVKTESFVTFQVLTLVLFSLTPFEQIVSSYPSVIGTLVAYLRIKDLADDLKEIEKDNPGEIGQLPRRDLIAKAPAFETIALKGMSTRYASRETSSFALGPIDFELKRGEVVFLIGRNGSGKTTFMNMLTGLLQPTAGVIEVDGKPVAAKDMDAYRAQFSAIFTQYHVFKTLYGLEDIEPDAADELIDKVHLKGITQIRPNGISRVDLSSGQRRRLALAIALLEDRNIMVLDEFVADQDPENRNYFFRTLLPWFKAQGKTVIVSTHDLAWMDCCDRAFKFENGQMSPQPLTPPAAAKPAAPAGGKPAAPAAGKPAAPAAAKPAAAPAKPAAAAVTPSPVAAAAGATPAAAAQPAGPADPATPSGKPDVAAGKS